MLRTWLCMPTSCFIEVSKNALNFQLTEDASCPSQCDEILSMIHKKALN